MAEVEKEMRNSLHTLIGMIMVMTVLIMSMVVAMRFYMLVGNDAMTQK
jgi:hypothetical protein